MQNFIEWLSPRKPLWQVLLIVVLIANITTVSHGSTFKISGNKLIIKTKRYEVVWFQGNMIELKTFLPGKTQISSTNNSINSVGLPNGVGSFYQNIEAVYEQHHPVKLRELPTSFPAQHMPDDDSSVSFREINNGIEITYKGLLSAKDDVLVQRLTVDPETEDLVIQQNAYSIHVGVFGIGFSLLNLKKAVKLIVPFFGGQKWGAELHVNRLRTVAWPKFWNAAIVIGEIDSGGVFAVWAQDPEMRAKYLHHLNGEKIQGLCFESTANAPYDKKQKVNACEWRFNTYSGNWMEPAKRYRDWMQTTYDIVPRKQRINAWANEISLVWPNKNYESMYLEKMAAKLQPKNILIMDWGVWPSFNRRIPEYIPKNNGYEMKIKLAHKYGYRVGVYSSMMLIDTDTHPELIGSLSMLPMINYLRGDQPNHPTPWLSAIHPGSKMWRSFYADKINQLVSKYGIDLYYQDISGSADGSYGTIDGLTLPKAVVSTEEKLLESSSDIALMGEYWNEINVCREDFGLINYLNWFDDSFRKHLAKRETTHPILSYLFSKFCLRVANSKPYNNAKRFHMEENLNEVTGAIPYWRASIDNRSGEAKIALERAILFSEGFRPYFPLKWQSDILAYMRDEKGRIVTYTAKGQSTYCHLTTGSKSNLLYARLNGVENISLKEDVYIPGWIGYGQTGPIGLNPNNWYCLFPGKVTGSKVTITNLPLQAFIKSVRNFGGGTLISLGGSGKGKISWRVNSKPSAIYVNSQKINQDQANVDVNLPTNILFEFNGTQGAKNEIVSSTALYLWPKNKDFKVVLLPLSRFQTKVYVNGLSVDRGVIQKCTYLLPNGRILDGVSILPPLGGEGSEVLLETMVKVPEKKKISMTIGGGLILECPGDGVHFVVRINDELVLRKYLNRKGYEILNVPMEQFAGKNVVLGIGADCGPAKDNTSCDWFFISRPYLKIEN